MRSAITIAQLIELLQKIENHNRQVCWVNGDTGDVGNIYLNEQKDLDMEAIDNGPIHIMLGDTEYRK